MVVTLGYTSEIDPSDSIGLADIAYGSNGTASENATMTDFYVYLRTISGLDCDVRCACYRKSDGVLIGQTDLTTIETTSSFVKYKIPASSPFNIVKDVDYYIIVNGDSPDDPYSIRLMGLISDQSPDKRIFGNNIPEDSALPDPFTFTETPGRIAIYASSEVATGLNMKINIGDSWKAVSAAKINIGDSWKTVSAIKQNIADSWKTV